MNRRPVIAGALIGLLGIGAVALAVTRAPEPALETFPEAVEPTSTATDSAPRPTVLQETTSTDTPRPSTSGDGAPPGSPTTSLSTSTSRATGQPASTTILTNTTTVAATTTSEAPAPSFQSSVGTVTSGDLHASWRQGCPLGIEELRAVSVSHWDYDGKVRTGTLIVSAELVDQVVAIMSDLYRARFPIERMEPVDVFGGSDDKSMAANNTSAFNCRAVSGGSSWSEHSYGRAIDINPLVNPYVRGSTVLPAEGSRYADRGLDAPGMIHAGDEVVDAFEARGWIWGGTWSSLKDYQHFSTTGR